MIGLYWGYQGEYKGIDLAATNKTLLGKFSRAFRFVEHGLVKVKRNGLLT